MKRLCLGSTVGLTTLLLLSTLTPGAAAAFSIEGVEARICERIDMVSRNDRAPFGLIESMEIPGQHFVRVGFEIVPVWSASVRHMQIHADRMELIDSQGRGHKVAGYVAHGTARFGDTYISLSRPRDWQAGKKAQPGFFEMIFAVPAGAVIKTLKLADVRAALTVGSRDEALVTESAPHIVVKGCRRVESLHREWQPPRGGIPNTTIAARHGRVLRVDIDLTPTGPNNTTLSGGRQSPRFLWSARRFGLFCESKGEKIFCGCGFGGATGRPNSIRPKSDGSFPAVAGHVFFVVPDGAKALQLTYALEPVASLVVGAKSAGAVSLDKLNVSPFPREAEVGFGIASGAARGYERLTGISAPERSPLGLVESIDVPGMRPVLVQFSLLPAWTAKGRRLEIPARAVALVDAEGKRHPPVAELMQSDLRPRFSFLSVSRPYDWKKTGAKAANRALVFLFPEGIGKATLSVGTQKRELAIDNAGGDLRAEPVPAVVVKGKQFLDSMPLARRLCPPATAATKLRTPFGKLLVLDVEIVPTGSNDTEPMGRFHWASSWVGLEYEFDGIRHHTPCVGEGHTWSGMAQLSDRFNSVEPTADGKLPVIATRLCFVVPAAARGLRLTWLMTPVCDL